jgi:hypothetical protein
VFLSVVAHYNRGRIGHRLVRHNSFQFNISQQQKLSNFVFYFFIYKRRGSNGLPNPTYLYAHKQMRQKMEMIDTIQTII